MDDEIRELLIGLGLVGYLFVMRGSTTFLFGRFDPGTVTVVLVWFVLGSPLFLVPLYRDGAVTIGWTQRRWVRYILGGLLFGSAASILLYLGMISMRFSAEVPLVQIAALFFFAFLVAALQEETLFRG